MWQLSLFVDGMACRRCVREVTARLRDVAGVEFVTADAATSSIRLLGTMAMTDVLSAFNESTYSARVIQEPRPALDG